MDANTKEIVASDLTKLVYENLSKHQTNNAPITKKDYDRYENKNQITENIEIIVDLYNRVFNALDNQE